MEAKLRGAESRESVLRRRLHEMEISMIGMDETQESEVLEAASGPAGQDARNGVADRENEIVRKNDFGTATTNNAAGAGAGAGVNHGAAVATRMNPRLPVEAKESADIESKQNQTVSMKQHTFGTGQDTSLMMGLPIQSTRVLPIDAHGLARHLAPLVRIDLQRAMARSAHRSGAAAEDQLGGVPRPIDPDDDIACILRPMAAVRALEGELHMQATLVRSLGQESEPRAAGTANRTDKDALSRQAASL